MLPIRTILFLFSALAICVNAFCNKSGCWEEFRDRDYKELMLISIGAGEICRSHCFDLDICNVIAYKGDRCYRQWRKDDPKFSIKAGSEPSYRLKESCRGDNCWSKTSLTRASLEWRKTKDVQQCKLICLETPQCYHYSYSEANCYIQTDEDFLKGITYDEKPELMKLSKECKDETCWTRKVNSFVGNLTKKAARGHDWCRVDCYENTKCKLYIYREAPGDCQIQTGDAELKGPKHDPSYTTFKMKSICWHKY